jgi:hypothetical protein
MTPAEPSVAFAYPADDAPAIDALAVQRMAVEFAFGSPRGGDRVVFFA